VLPLAACKGDDGGADGGESSTGDTGGVNLETGGVETSADTGETGSETTGGTPGECVVTECSGKVYECGDCLDNDDDGSADVADANCWGPCDNNEAGFKGNIPGQNQAPCTVMDCYFDGDSGTGNDGCYWSHACDPSEPSPSGCNYNPNAQIPGSGLDCETAQQMQAPLCEDYCEPLTPNGCDCFGCCEVEHEGEYYTVFLGTGGDEGTCSVEDVADPDKCAPCVQVESCFNPCVEEECEICIGDTVIPEDCDEAGCPDGIQPCDPANNSSDCPQGLICLTGCCYPSPE
jgi:hypothetical protein